MSYGTNDGITVWVEDGDGGDPIAVPLPTRWEVCSYCDGEGKSSAYLGAFTAGEMGEMGDEFYEDYMRGNYDKPCPECHGRTTVAVVDEDRTSPELLEKWYKQQEEEWDLREMERQERMMGC